MNLRNTCVKLVIPVACTYGEPLCDEVRAWFIYRLPSLWVEVGIERWLTPTNPSPRSMRSSTLLRGLINFCNKYVSSLWLMLSPWIIRTLTLPSLLASSVPCIALSHTRELVQTSPVHPNPVIWYALSHINLLISSSKQPPYLPIMAFP